MPTYIILGNYTEQGITNMKASPNRLDKGRAMLEELGCRLKAFYLTMGHHDNVAIIEAPDASTAAKFLLALGAQGNLRTTTLQAFEEDEYRQIVADLP